MNKRSKILAGLVAAITVLSVMCFGFAKWSSDITLSGSVSASGKWDVEITDAALTSLSAGSETSAEPTVIKATAAVTVYDLKLYALSNGNYIYQIDDLNGKEVTLTADEFAQYDVRLSTSNTANHYSSGTKPGLMTYYVNIDENCSEWIAYRNATNLATTTTNTDNGASDGKTVGSVIAWLCGGSSTGTPANDTLSLTWKTASDKLAAASDIVTYPAELSENNTVASYAPVNFTLPGAWASYTVTVVNNGTVNANLSDYDLAVTELEAPYSVDMPSFSEDEVLAPGESCTITFVISVDTNDNSLDAESQSFSVKLSYVQDTVETAPAASHNHN